MNIYPEIPGLSPEKVQTLTNCRWLKQYTSMIEDYTNGKCPFCDPLGDKNIVIAEQGEWRMWVNPFPIAHTKLHLVMATRMHTQGVLAIRHQDFANMGALFIWAAKEYQIRGGAFAMRFGLPEWNAGSVLHQHANIIVPDQTGAVQVTLAKEPEKVEENIKRMYAFEKLRNGATVEHLTTEEQKLVEGRV